MLRIKDVSKALRRWNLLPKVPGHQCYVFHVHYAVVVYVCIWVPVARTWTRPERSGNHRYVLHVNNSVGPTVRARYVAHD